MSIHGFFHVWEVSGSTLGLEIFYWLRFKGLHYSFSSQMLKHYLYNNTISTWDRGGTVVKVLCYKSEGRWFDSRWCNWNFSLT